MLTITILTLFKNKYRSIVVVVCCFFLFFTLNYNYSQFLCVENMICLSYEFSYWDTTTSIKNIKPLQIRQSVFSQNDCINHLKNGYHKR